MRNTALVLLATAFLSFPAKAQTAFDAPSVAYVLCITNETKKLALVMPPISKEVIVERAFHACGDQEAELRKSLAERGMTQSAAEDRLAQIRKFIRQTAPDDVERFRVNSARPR